MMFLAASLLSVLLSSVTYAEDLKLKEEWGQMRAEGKAARAEEMKLRQEAKAAFKAGDVEKAKAIRAQLKETHEENITQLKDKKSNIQEKRLELKEQHKARREELKQVGISEKRAKHREERREKRK